MSLRLPKLSRKPASDKVNLSRFQSEKQVSGHAVLHGIFHYFIKA